MANVIQFVPKFKTPTDNLDAFIKHCRDDLSIYEDQGGFKVDEWKTKHSRPISMRFSVYEGPVTGSVFTPMPAPYSLFAKSYVRYLQSLKEVSSISKEIVALQAVYDALIEVHGVAEILKTDGLVQKKAREILESRYPKSPSLYRYGGALQKMYKFVREKGFAPSLPIWKNPWKKPREKAQRTDAESRKWQEERCPTLHEMLMLADCFHKAQKPQDQYWSSVCTLLMFAPGRGSEPMDLTIDCLGQEDGHYYVSWFSKKGFGGTKKWVPEVLVDTVKEAIRRLTEIGQPARDAAKFAYDNPGIFMRHPGCITPASFPDDKPLSFNELCAAIDMTASAQYAHEMGVSEETAWKNLSGKTKWVKKLLEGGPVTYKRLAEYVASKYIHDNWPEIKNTDRPIWESLLLIRENEFHAEFETKQFSWELPSINRLNNQLGYRVAPTMFERFGLKDEDGSEIYMTSHQPRVWLSTIAERGGMDSWQLAQWAGRARIQDNMHYDMRAESEKIAQARSIIVRKQAPEALEAVKMNLPVTYESLGVNRIGIADPTQWGYCVHDFGMSPCRKGGDCMICKEHVCIKGLPEALDRLKVLEGQVAGQLEKAKDADGSGVFGADRWVTYLGWKLAHITTQIKRQEDPNTPDGAVLWIPPEHDPSPVKRALDAQGHNTSTGTKSPDVKQVQELKKIMGF